MAARRRAAARKTNAKRIGRKASATSLRTGPEDIITYILDDHKPLKQLIKILKDSDRPVTERQEAFAEFAPLLISHAKPEEQSLYVYMKQDKNLRTEGFEGDVEHTLADQMVEEAKRTEDDDLWAARVKVLAELVEHHIKEEESDLLPDFKKHSTNAMRLDLGQQFLALKTQMQAQGGEDTVSEKDVGLGDHVGEMDLPFEDSSQQFNADLTPGPDEESNSITNIPYV
jgi:hemerythrin superfamily protein